MTRPVDAATRIRDAVYADVRQRQPDDFAWRWAQRVAANPALWLVYAPRTLERNDEVDYLDGTPTVYEPADWGARQ